MRDEGGGVGRDSSEQLVLSCRSHTCQPEMAKMTEIFHQND